MSGSAYLVVSQIPYEQPDIIAVWMEEKEALRHMARLGAAWYAERTHLVAPGSPPYSVWTIPFQPDDDA